MKTVGRVVAAGGVVGERFPSIGRVIAADRLLSRAATPTAVLSPPVFNKSAAVPTAVLLFPVLRSSAPAPTAVLLLPSVLAKSAYQPNTAFARPVMLLKRAWPPSAVLDGSSQFSDNGHAPRRQLMGRNYIQTNDDQQRPILAQKLFKFFSRAASTSGRTKARVTAQMTF